MGWIIDAAMISGKGKIRDNNEDSYYFNGQKSSLETINKDNSFHIKESTKYSLWAICDGMGGYDNGEIASNLVVSSMERLQKKLKGRDFSTIITEWSRTVNQEVYRQTLGGGCTLALLYFQTNYAYLAHIGDSRIYRLHNKELKRLTRDHSKVELLVATGKITEEEAQNHPQKNIITRYLGMDNDSICDATIGDRCPIIPGDIYLLCSDGITDMLDDNTVRNILISNLDASNAAQTIYNEAMRKGGRDNATIIILKILNETTDNEDSTNEDEPTVPNKETKAKGISVQISGNAQATVNCKVVLGNSPSNVNIAIEQ